MLLLILLNLILLLLPAAAALAAAACPGAAQEVKPGRQRGKGAFLPGAAAFEGEGALPAPAAAEEERQGRDGLRGRGLARHAPLALDS